MRLHLKDIKVLDSSILFQGTKNTNLSRMGCTTSMGEIGLVMLATYFGTQKMVESDKCEADP